jgi:hypothetical protein
MASAVKLTIAVFVCLMLLWPGVATAEAPTPKTGTWKGKTSQGKPIEFKVEKQRGGWQVTSAKIKFSGKCEATYFDYPITAENEGTVIYPVMNPDTHKPDRGNHYSESKDAWSWSHFGAGDPPQENVVDVGSFSAVYGEFKDEDTAKGFLKASSWVELADGTGEKCKTPGVTWKAHS